MQLNFSQQGHGFPLIILHGLFGSHDNWQGISRQLGEQYQVFAVDLRNHGRSPHSEEFNFPLMVGDLSEFMATQKISRAHLIGHSLGGKVAMHFALREPEQVEKLVVVDMSPKAYAPRHNELFTAMLSLDLSKYRERSEIAAALLPAVPELAVRQFLLKNVGRDESGIFFWKLNLPSLHHNYPLLNQAIESPTQFMHPVLFIKGGQSDYLDAEDEIVVRRNFPHAEIKVIPQAGHWVQAEAPAEFLKMVAQFLQ